MKKKIKFKCQLGLNCYLPNKIKQILLNEYYYIKICYNVTVIQCVNDMSKYKIKIMKTKNYLKIY